MTYHLRLRDVYIRPNCTQSFLLSTSTSLTTPLPPPTTISTTDILEKTRVIHSPYVPLPTTIIFNKTASSPPDYWYHPSHREHKITLTYACILADMADIDSATSITSVERNKIDTTRATEIQQRVSVKAEITKLIEPYKKRTNEPPPFSSAELVVIAALCSDLPRVMKEDILKWILRTFAYYMERAVDEYVDVAVEIPGRDHSPRTSVYAFFGILRGLAEVRRLTRRSRRQGRARSAHFGGVVQCLS